MKIGVDLSNPTQKVLETMPYSGVRVPSEGPNTAEIALVGEAPGATEVKMVRPFVGAAGNLLNKCLNKAAVPRPLVYVTNVFKTRPKDNNVTLFFHDAKNTKVKDAYLSDIEELYEELNNLPNLKVVVALGRTALWAFTGEQKITKYRGSPLKSKHLPAHVTVLPAYHPAACLHQFNWVRVLSYDLTKARDLAEGKIAVRTDRDPLLPNHANFRSRCMEYLQSVKKDDLIAVDIEVMNQQVSCIAIAKSATSCLVVPFLTSPMANQDTLDRPPLVDPKPVDAFSFWTPEEEVAVWRELFRILEDPDIAKIYQNAMFDITICWRRHGIMTQGPLFDTMLMHHNIYCELPRGLDFLTSFYLVEPYYKDELKEWGLNKADFRKLWEYNAKDGMYTYEIYEEEKLEIKELDLQRPVDFDHALIYPLMYMSALGIKVDVDALHEHKTHLEQVAEEGERLLTEFAGHPVNVNSPKQIQLLLYGKPPHGLGLPRKKNRKTGTTTTNKDAIDLLKRNVREGSDAHVVLSTITKVRESRKLIGTYLDLKYTGDQRIHASYNIGGAATGRISSSKDIFGEGVQMQNIPKLVRNIFIPDEDRILVQADLSQAEARVVAELSRDPSLIELFKSGRDSHVVNAARVYNISEEEVTKKLREIGKRIAHASNYGMSWNTLATNASIPAAEAKIRLEAYHRAYPGIRAWHSSIIEELKDNERVLVNPFGRRYQFIGRWGDDMFRAAFAFKPQSTVADVLNRAIIWFYNNFHLHEELQYVQLLTQVHDSIVFQVPEVHMIPACKLLKKAMEADIEFRHPNGQVSHLSIPADFEYSHNNWRDLQDLPKEELQ